MSKIDVDINADKIAQTIFDNRDVKLFAANTVRKEIDEYVPYLDGDLSTSVTIEPDQIIYEMPYANRMYKHPEYNFTKDQHPLATAKWDVVGMKSKRSTVSKQIEDYIKVRNK